jgi:hypothetical protein
MCSLTLASNVPLRANGEDSTKSGRTSTSKWDPYGTCARKVVAQTLSKSQPLFFFFLFFLASSRLQASGKTHNHSRVAARPQSALASEAVVVIYINI